jgi:ribosomal protein L11 methyltransferase
MSTYFLLKILRVPRADEELLSMECFDQGAMGVCESLQFRQTSLEYEPEIIETETLDMDVYFERAPPGSFVESLKARFPSVEISLSEEAEKDWLEEWKKGFEPFELVEGIWIVPSWRKPPAEAARVIWMEPGMAFGTGTHETTQLAARLLASLKGSDLHSLLDVGTGTGVLAVLAERLGFGRIEATEIDPVARDVGRENVRRNSCSRIKILDQQVNEVEGLYDVVVANIIDGVLIRISADLKARVKPGGRLLLTGVLQERAAEFLPEFFGVERESFELVHEAQRGEWMGYLLERRR